MKISSATYRLQLSPDFTFEALEKILDYLEQLGISTIYAAPIFQSRKGSTHGYDVLDPYSINREIGNLEQFREISEVLKQKNMTWLQDIVPNHMAFDGGNPYLRDIFELGPNSRFYNFFDIDWDYKDWGQVMAPFLGAPLEEILENSELKLKFSEDGFSINYYDHSYPTSARSYAKILATTEAEAWKKKFEEFNGEAGAFSDLKKAFYREVQENSELKSAVNNAVEEINTSPEKMQAVLDLQYFRPTHWKQTEKEINYRRFFTINDLICVSMENQEVFDTYHFFIFELVNQGIINGLRIDHIDGLFDPEGYVDKLKKMLGDDFYVIVEKILEWDENLPKKWATEGTSGYDFLAEVNQLFTKQKNEAEFTQAYEKNFPKVPAYEDLVYDKKLYILKERMAGELQNLYFLLKKNQLITEEANETEWKEALSAFLAAFPVYRIYPKTFPLNKHQNNVVNIAFNKASEKAPQRKKELEHLKSIFTGEAGKEEGQMLYFLQRCQQFSGPLAAKGVEDTSFYIYNRLISHNEVGDSPEHFGISIEGFHEKMLQRQKDFPYSINATATHDTKRGEDARMRLNVLSEIPQEWFQKVEEWQQITTDFRKNKEVPGKNEEYFIYQTLLGAMPFENKNQAQFLQRTKDYLQKVLREAKVHSNWSEPDEAYENDVLEFIEDILKNEKFRNSFDAFQQKITAFGALKSLGQLLLKITVPGAPDIYQGTELWDLSYVDPDNRRPVNYNLLKSYLSEFENYNSSNLNKKINQLKREISNGKLKMYSLYKALIERRRNEELIENGEYIPLKISGKAAENFIAFARRLGDDWVIITVPALVTEIFDFEKFSLKENALEDLQLSLPKDAPKEWENIFMNEKISTSEGKIQLSEPFSRFPIAFLKMKK